MKGNYIYNKGTHTLHIEGYCRHAPKDVAERCGYLRFNTEDEAVAYDRRSVSMCRICMRKREQILRNN